MLKVSTVKFLEQLKLNNNKPWFDAHRSQYDAAKEDFEAFTDALLKETAAFDASVAHLTAKQCTFRINRDVRFSKNKDPYKSHFALHITAGGKKVMNAGYYFHAEPNAAFLACGIWMPMAPDLKKIRQEIDYNFAAFNGIITSKSFKKAFGGLAQTDVLSRPPKGYEADNPAIEMLKLKSFIASVPLPKAALCSNDLVKLAASKFRVAMPLIHFINQALAHDVP
ncbi:MAG: DUF2461 domain-containing protein [Bacteroidetes bacterium]|nr:MAG: DUF2461 domain-containing protein [Bacteroidota bacterium]